MNNAMQSCFSQQQYSHWSQDINGIGGGDIYPEVVGKVEDTEVLPVGLPRMGKVPPSQQRLRVQSEPPKGLAFSGVLPQ